MADGKVLPKELSITRHQGSMMRGLSPAGPVALAIFELIARGPISYFVIRADTAVFVNRPGGRAFLSGPWDWALGDNWLQTMRMPGLVP
jgi:hypothetical protein